MTAIVYRDKPPEFTELVGLVNRSVVAVAVGTKLDDAPNIVGTGFAAEFSEYFATCWHVAKAHDEITSLTPADLKARGLKDSKLRIALPTGTSYIWRELENYTWLRGMSEQADTCVLRLVGIAIPPLTLHKGDFVLGADVGVIGFPLGNALQGRELRPIVARTLLAGAIDPTTANQLSAGKAVLAQALAGGFSGSPVFSATDGTVMGMVSSKPLELTDLGTWPAGLSLAVLPTDIYQVLMKGVETTNRVIKDSLRQALAKK
jgi:hypothetical protein